jgi:lipopolysaccharide/colanic/teichoic acid biosynthesis glycosyltransferase
MYAFSHISVSPGDARSVPVPPEDRSHRAAAAQFDCGVSETFESEARAARSTGNGLSDRSQAIDSPAVSVPAEGSGPRNDLCYQWTTRIIDVLVSSLMLIATSPIMIVLAILIRWDSRGPALFRHQRVGVDRRSRRPSAFTGTDRRQLKRSGKPFTLYKFRTMYEDARERFPELYAYRYTDDELSTLPIKVLLGTKRDPAQIDGPIKQLDDDLHDPRITRVGRWLRRTSLDELPNFLNVLKGDLQLVGPRPDIEENIRYYSPRHLRKLSVKPGATGLAQVSGRGNLTFDDTNEYDLEYVENQSIGLDLNILLRTFLVLWKREGAA